MMRALAAVFPFSDMHGIVDDAYLKKGGLGAAPRQEAATHLLQGRLGPLSDDKFDARATDRR
jgi:hypothetical protein